MPERVFSDVVKYCKERRHPVELFRINVSGEVENPTQLLTWFSVAIACPDTKFYMYTKNTAVLEKTLEYAGNIPANLAINISQWDNTVENKFGLQEFIYDDGSDKSLENVFHCPAVGKGGESTGVKCSQCRRCTRRCDGQKTAVYAH